MHSRERYASLLPMLSLFPRGMNKRWWLFRPIDCLLFFKKSRRPKRGLLVVRMDGLGDMILCRAALEHYPRIFNLPKNEITILGCDSWKSLAPEIFNGFNVVTIDEHAFEKRFFYRLKIALWLSRQAFHTAVCDMFMRKTMTADSLLYYSYAQEIIVSTNYLSKKTEPRFRYYQKLYTRVIDTGPHPLHETIRHFNFISAIAEDCIPPEPPTIPWRKIPSPIKAETPYIVINFGSNEPGRRWPFERFIAIAKRIIARGYTVVFIGGPKEAAQSSLLAHELQHPRAIDFILKTDLPGVLDVIRSAFAVLTTETGPGHFAMALGRPTLMLCGGGSNIQFTPFPESIRAPTMRFLNFYMECYQCLWLCPYQKNRNTAFPCLDNISAEDAWTAFEKWVPQTNVSTISPAKTEADTVH